MMTSGWASHRSMLTLVIELHLPSSLRVPSSETKFCSAVRKRTGPFNNICTYVTPRADRRCATYVDFQSVQRAGCGSAMYKPHVMSLHPYRAAKVRLYASSLLSHPVGRFYHTCEFHPRTDVACLLVTRIGESGRDRQPWHLQANFQLHRRGTACHRREPSCVGDARRCYAALATASPTPSLNLKSLAAQINAPNPKPLPEPYKLHQPLRAACPKSSCVHQHAFW